MPNCNLQEISLLLNLFDDEVIFHDEKDSVVKLVKLQTQKNNLDINRFLQQHQQKDRLPYIYLNPMILIIGASDVNYIQNIYSNIENARYHIIYEKKAVSLGITNVESYVVKDEMETEDILIQLRKISNYYDVIFVNTELKWNVYRTNMVIRLFMDGIDDRFNTKMIIFHKLIMKQQKWDFVKTLHSDLIFENKGNNKFFIYKKK